MDVPTIAYGWMLATGGLLAAVFSQRGLERWRLAHQEQRRARLRAKPNMKPVLVLDIDNTLCDYMGLFLPFLASRGMVFSLDQVTENMGPLGVPDEAFDEFGYCCLRQLELFPGTLEALQELRNTFDLFLVTARPPQREPETRDWLEAQFPPGFFRQLIFSQDKGKVCRHLKAFALVEDQVKFLRQFSRSYAYARPWNTSWTGARGEWPRLAQHILRDYQQFRSTRRS